jgi:predicted Zn-dependent peptidase
MVEDKKKALGVFSFGRPLMDYSIYTIGAIPLGENSLDDLITEMDEEIVKLQTTLISDEDLQKVRNKFENRFVSSNSNIQGIASSLASNYMLMGDTNRINTELELVMSITKEEIREAAKKYLAKNRRVVIDYLPESQKK